MKNISIYTGCRLREEKEVAKDLKKELGMNKAIIYANEMSNHCYKKSFAMAEYWRKIKYIIENPQSKIKIIL